MKVTPVKTVFVMVFVAVLLAGAIALIINWARGPKELGRISLRASAAEIEHNEAFTKKTTENTGTTRADTEDEGYSESENESVSTGQHSGNQATIPATGETDAHTGKVVSSVEKISESTVTVNGKTVHSETYKIVFSDGTSCVRGSKAVGTTSSGIGNSRDLMVKPSVWSKLATMLNRTLNTFRARLDELKLFSKS